LHFDICSDTITFDMIQVTRKDNNEANENILRRFSRKVQQSGVLTTVKSLQRFEKPISKTERRKKAIVRGVRKAEKAKRMRLGLK
jgi:ribosomal protein S21